MKIVKAVTVNVTKKTWEIETEFERYQGQLVESPWGGLVPLGHENIPGLSEIQAKGMIVRMVENAEEKKKPKRTRKRKR